MECLQWIYNCEAVCVCSRISSPKLLSLLGTSPLLGAQIKFFPVVWQND